MAFFNPTVRASKPEPNPASKLPTRGGLTKPGIIRRNSEITHEVQNVSPAYCITCHHCHHRFGQSADLHLQVEDIEVSGALVVVIPTIVTAYPLITAGAESIAPRTSKNDHADLGIEMCVGERFNQLFDRLGSKRVSHFWTVYGNSRYPLRMVVKEVLTRDIRYRCPLHRQLSGSWAHAIVCC